MTAHHASIVIRTVVDRRESEVAVVVYRLQVGQLLPMSIHTLFGLLGGMSVDVDSREETKSATRAIERPGKTTLTRMLYAQVTQ